jgi:surfeit locus 1 family protein
MRIGPYEFRPGLWPTLLTAALLSLLLSLGYWQLGRAEFKRGLRATEQAQAVEPPLVIEAAPHDEALRYRLARASGHYDTAHQILLDNQVYQGQAGYQVYTPLRLANGDVLLIARGWLPLGADRSRLPGLPTPSGAQTPEGRLDRPPAAGIRLGDVPETGWPRVVQRLDPVAIGRELGLRTAPLVLKLDPAAAGGFVRDWRRPPQMGPEKHLGYAVQWFGLAAALVLIYLVVNTRRAKVKDNT